MAVGSYNPAMDQHRKCSIDKTDGNPVATLGTSNVSELLAMRQRECGQPANYKLMPSASMRAESAKHQLFKNSEHQDSESMALAYVCEGHAERFRFVPDLELIRL